MLICESFLFYLMVGGWPLFCYPWTHRNGRSTSVNHTAQNEASPLMPTEQF